ncbi:MAG TPA: transcription termination factor Rho [Chthoniobacterales bacterium]
MSEESENQQQSVDEKPAPARRRRPSRRGARGRNGGRTPRARQPDKEVPTAASVNGDDSRTEPHTEAAERMTGASVQDSYLSDGASAGTDAGEVASSGLAGKMALGNPETTTEVAAEDLAASAPQNERGFRNRDRDRDRGQNAYSNGDQIDREPEFGEGVIEISGKGFGFLRDAKRNFVQTPQDIFVTPEIVRRFALRDGMWIQGETRRGNRGPQLMRLNKINDDEPTKYQGLTPFEELTTINPNKRIKLETVPERYTTRIMDLMTPLGMGQRGLIVAPPRTGKTTLLHHIADAVTKNHPEMKLIILLVDERPEEVTDFRRSCPGAEIMASSNDSDIKSHTRIAQLAIERAKRMVEAGKHVFILLDSITRTARAFNNATGGGGRTMSGGIDARAMEIPRKIFAAARNTEEAGSLTIVATALIETGSRMDELIFQEFKGTGNMELVLDRKISDQRIYPAVDIFLSGTRREELLLQAWELEKINLIRRGLAGHKPEEAIQRLLMFVKKFPTNTQMLKEIPG